MVTSKKISITTVLALFVAITFLSILFRFALPLGDEPDYGFRVNSILWSSDRNVFSDILKPIYQGYDMTPGCDYTASALSLSHSISGMMCGEAIELKLQRILWFVFLMFLLLCHYFFIIFSQSLTGKCKNDRLIRYQYLFISLCYPSLMYYMGVVAEEHLALFFSLLFFIYYRTRFFLFFLLTVIALIDSGSVIVVISFYLLLSFSNKIYSKYSLKLVLYIHSIIIVNALVLGSSILPLLDALPIIGSKSAVIYHDYQYVYDIGGKYPTILRPVVTFMTGIFMTPSGLKPVVLYIIAAFFLLVGCLSVYKNKDIDSIIILSSIFTLICSFSFVVTGFENAKYYIFLFPFILYSFKNVFGAKRIACFGIFCSLFVISSLFIFRL